MIGENPRILKQDDNDPQIYVDMWKTIKTKKQIWTGHLKNKKKDGTPYEEELIIIPIKRGRRKPTHFVGIQQDVTEIEKLRKRESVKEALAETVKQIEKIGKR